MTFHANSLSDQTAAIYFWVLFAVGVISYLIVSHRKSRGIYDKSDKWLVVYLCCIACLVGAVGLLCLYEVIPSDIFTPSSLPVASPETFLR
jgi:hypothetical protein